MDINNDPMIPSFAVKIVPAPKPTAETRAEPSRIDEFLHKYDLWLNEDASADLIILCNSFYLQRGASERERALEEAAKWLEGSGQPGYATEIRALKGTK